MIIAIRIEDSGHPLMVKSGYLKSPITRRVNSHATKGYREKHVSSDKLVRAPKGGQALNMDSICVFQEETPKKKALSTG
jgi:hypothetical protein